MRLEKVIFRAGDEKRDIHCYQITAVSYLTIWDGKPYAGLLPVIELNLNRANNRAGYYERNCAGRRYEQHSAAFWTKMLQLGKEGSDVSVLFEEIKQ